MSFSIQHFSEIFVKRRKIKNLVLQNIVKNLSTKTNIIEERKVNVDGISINYAKTGTGEHTVLLLPGVMGTIWTDFKPQIENLNNEQLTLIVWEPPGYGKSRPPNRTFPRNFHRRDATWACNLMKTLGYNKFSLLGWSDGGMTSLILAATYPENIEKMIVTATHAYMTPVEMKRYETVMNAKNWSRKIRAPLIDIYGEEYLEDVMVSWLDARRFIFHKNNGDICKGDLCKIKCPSLIVYGKKDVLVTGEHIDFLKANIKNSRVEIFNDGAHNLHLRYPDEFNDLVHKFLIDHKDSKP